ncbi:MAG: GTP 3',8-cyclase MoaA [Micrococcales bacterium]|nr:GTP 3',8-cyclase MoaA [Micrococcales bacterium]
MSGDLLVDGFGRRHRDLRVSVTDRCPLRCVYCVPASGAPLMPSAHLLSADEIVRVVRVAVRMGVTRVRLTGGEPLLRPDVVEIVAGIAALPDAPRLSMTTSGVGLDRLAGRLAEAGLERVNVSLDTVDPARYRQVTRRGCLDQVLDGLSAARAAGLRPIKLNAVLVRGLNDADAVPLLDFALGHGYELRFIEQMPLDGGRVWRRESMVTADEILDRLGQTWTLTPVPERGPAPAARWLVDGGPGTVGIVAAVTAPFCGACERLRLTADGQVRSCLFSTVEHDLRGMLRRGATDAALVRALLGCVRAKPSGHEIDAPGFVQPARQMSAIGG